MPRHDYRCLTCGGLLLDQYRTTQEGGSAHLPVCPRCGVLMQWIPQANFDLRSDSATSDIPKFTTRDGYGNLVEIDSLHKLRQVERESEIAAKNGEGQQIAFRAYSNNRGNRLDNTFGEPPSQAIDPHIKRKFGLQGATKLIDAAAGEPDRAYGPGVTDANTSALDHLEGS